jgi:RNA polymerase subunit RPABC4/transcription elongation factor Spt4
VSVNTQQNVAVTACPFCGSAVEPDYEICPVCGHKLVEYCTFCGASMTATDIDCPECGMPSDGITCPDCGTLNFRSFCRKCNRPLSRAARKAVEKAKADPKVQEAVSILVKMAELEAEMQNAIEEDDITDDTPHEPTEKELRLRELMGKVGFKPAEKPKVQPKQNTSRSREEIQTEYQRMMEEANKVLASMVPPAGSTPQEQRNYSTARKVAVMETYKEKVTVSYIARQKEILGWVCYRCQIFHNCPEDCAVKEYGGYYTTRTVDVWATREEEVEKQKKVYKRIE